MRPRAKEVIPFKELDIGMDVMVNFNMEEHEERGWLVEEFNLEKYPTFKCTNFQVVRGKGDRVEVHEQLEVFGG